MRDLLRGRVRRHALVGLGVALLSAAGCGGDPRDARESPAARGAGFDPRLARVLQATLTEQRAIHELPGVAAAVAIPGHGVWSGGSGVADRRTRRAVTGQTPFAIASVTKPFIASLVVKLAEDGRLGLDDPLSRWLPDYPNARRITLRQLLNHTSGLFGVDENRAYMRAVDGALERRWTPARTLRYVRRPYFAPGAGWHYSDTNYVLLGVVIRRASGSTVARELHRRVLDPLGLRNVVLQPDERASRVSARGYGSLEPGGRHGEISDGSSYVPYTSLASSEWTAGAMVANAESVARFGDALFAGRVVKQSSLEQMRAFVAANLVGYDGYGLGIGRRRSPALGREMWGALGLIPGFGSGLWHLPKERVTVAVLWNDSTVLESNDLGDALLEAVLEQREAG